MAEDEPTGRVAGKVAIITGAASGLGKADAQRLAEEGARLVLTDIDVDGGSHVAAACDALFIEQDVGDEHSWEKVVAAALDTYGRLDVLVNNAGIAPIADIETTTTEVWNKTLRVHLDGTFFGCRAALPAMVASGGGSLINMSSVAALVGIPPYLAYSAAKGGIRSMTKSIAMYCREKKNGVRCNSVHPGSIDTPMVETALREIVGLELSEQEDRAATRAALGIGEPLDIANLVLFLASDESKHVNGAELVVDGASTLGNG